MSPPFSLGVGAELARAPNEGRTWHPKGASELGSYQSEKKKHLRKNPCPERRASFVESMKTEFPMSAYSPSSPSLGDRELAIARVIDAPREMVFAAWTGHLPEWWGPHGMSTPVFELDLRPGGIFRTVMRAPDGSEYRTRGVFLEVIPNERIVFTDAFDGGWAPHPDAFFTAVIGFEDLPVARTRYSARALHWSAANRARHERMGFHQGWGESLDRLEACVHRLNLASAGHP